MKSTRLFFSFLFVTIITLLSAHCAFAANGYPDTEWPTGTPESQGMSTAKLIEARDYARQGAGGGSGMIIRHGVVVMTWGSQTQLYDLKSSTKSFGVTAMGLAIADGKLNWDDKAATLVPSFGIPPESNASTGWLDRITLRHLATQTAGFDKPGGFERLLFAPGTDWFYSDGGPNWLADAITLAYRQDINTLLFNRVFTPIGIQSSDLVWRSNAYRPTTLGGVVRREFGSGISANVDAMARFGYLYLRKGRWENTQIIPETFVNEVGKKDSAVPGASSNYGHLWWTKMSGLPSDAYWTSGQYDSHILVIPSLDIVAVRAGNLGYEWPQGNGPFYLPIAQSVTGSGTNPVPTVNLSANPASLVAGNSTTLSWSSENATSCTGSGFSTGNRTSGSTTVSPSHTTSYTINCTGTGGTASDSVTVTIQSSSASCLLFPPNSTPPAGYAASWDVFSPGRELLIQTNCPSSGTSLGLTVGKGDANQIVYKVSYSYQVGMTPPWQPTTLSGLISTGDWLRGIGMGSLTAPSTASYTNPFFFVGYACTNRSGVWKCGCSDTSCSAGKWQLQGYTGNGGGTTGGPPPSSFPAIASCGETIAVTPSSINQNLGDGCKILTLAPGTYSSVKIDGHSGGVLTLRCQSPGTCRFQGGNESSTVNIQNSNGIIVDGILWENPGTGYFTIRTSSNVLIKNSTFRNMTGSGILVLDDSTENIQIVGNAFHNDPTRTERQLPDGSYDYTMDYGIRLYDAKSVFIGNNTFTGGFNHAISFKSKVNFGIVSGNQFSDCGRICMHVGQTPIMQHTGDNSVGEVIIKDNTFTNIRGSIMGIMNVAKATITGNTYPRSKNLYTVVNFYEGMNGCQDGCVGVIGNGAPANRQVIASGNIAN